MWDYVSYVCWGTGEHSACAYDDCHCVCHVSETRKDRRQRVRQGEKYRVGLQRMSWFATEQLQKAALP